MAARLGLASLFSRSASISASSSVRSLRGGGVAAVASGIQRFGTAAEVEVAPITPPVHVNYTKLLINGQFVDAATGKTFPTLDPRTGEVIAHVAEGDVEDVNRAVSAARKAFDEGPWPKMTGYERSRILNRFADLIEKHNDEIAALETWDNGKPYEQSAQVEIPMLARLIRYYAGWADKIHGLIVPADGPHHVQVLHEPIGVAGQIIPWNFPLLMFAWKAGVPDGVLNVISGFGPTAGAALARHMDVDKLAFTGSTDTGKIVLELAAKSNLKSVTLELGGKSPMIILDDADIDQAVELAHFALFFNQGQCCCAGSRTFVHERVYDEFVEKAKARALKRVVGDPFKKGVEQGPQIDEEQFNKILRYIQVGKDSGATLVSGGDRVGSKGYYIQPTIFSDVKDGMLIAKEEIFGPVQSILKFNDLDEVIRRANATRYGLAAGVFTSSLDNANTLTRALRVGTVWINCFDVFDAAIPFGGYKMSGQGREKGIDSLKNYLQIKAVVTSLKNPAWLASTAAAAAGLTAEISHVRGSYLVSLSIGTPPITFSASPSTVSDLIWTQCQPCTQCFTQSTPIYDPSKSSSFSKLPCSDNLCKASQKSNCTPDCEYNQTYAGGFSHGVMGIETFTSGEDSVPGIAFGCGNSNTFTVASGSGLVGLGRGPLSLISQLGVTKFSYCLPPLGQAKGKLLLGSQAVLKTKAAILSTPLVQNPSIKSSFYYLSLQGITVGTTRLSIPDGALQVKKDGTGGMIISSGTLFPRLEKTIFGLLKEEFRSQLKLPFADQSSLGFDACFSLPSNANVEAPKLIYHFDGGDMELPEDNYLFIDSTKGFMCLQILESEFDLSVFAGIHHQNMQTLYDLEKEMISFVPAQCDEL
ncbi:hypothetical protein J5N97_005012 [Dioscorea zingiberensis]|uniref:aldehyde dehydrogenase (NAD(+)) n=1 Tax=Dioscorea zingiberensis TaxID=325984 RepID=A0A9D5HSC5_9LILI|nr:hypothetical protein J5N97_005012 [Dioscorea zingiberensis]